MILKYKSFLESVRVSPILLNLKNNVDTELISKIRGLVKPPSKILEISCGNGSDSNHLKDLGYNVTSTDNNKDYVDNAKKLGINCILHDTTQPFPFDDNSFDLIYSRLGLHYFTMEQLDDIFSELSRIGNYLVFTVKLVDDISTGKVIFTKDTWMDITNKYFEVISSEEKSGILYDNQSRWLEIVAKNKSDI
jgi:ubiquinone/menaquinone biosynthesis C-methylase UbiE